MSATEHTCCEKCRAELDAAHRRIGELEAELEAARAQLREVVKHDALQGQDLERLRGEYERTRPNCPERVLGNEAQLAFERVLESFGDVVAVNDEAKSGDASASETPDKKGDKEKRRHRHGRRRLDLTNLPVESVFIDPPEVEAAGGKGYERIGQEASERLAFRPAQYFRLRLVRGKWARVSESEPDAIETSPSDIDADEAKPVLIAPLPGGVWPTVMADPSAVAQVILSKYDDVLPLYRQERISVRQGFALPRSTQCGWLAIAYAIVCRIVEAMRAEACRTAFCIATDATGAPVRAKGGSAKWHVFVLIADRDHIIFRYDQEHSGDTVRAFLEQVDEPSQRRRAGLLPIDVREHLAIVLHLVERRTRAEELHHHAIRCVDRSSVHGALVPGAGEGVEPSRGGGNPPGHHWTPQRKARALRAWGASLGGALAFAREKYPG